MTAESRFSGGRTSGFMLWLQRSRGPMTAESGKMLAGSREGCRQASTEPRSDDRGESPALAAACAAPIVCFNGAAVR